MKRDRLRPAYQNLTGEERFRLSIRAGARGDAAESGYLLSTAPKLEGTAMDPGFTEPAMASYRMTAAFAQAAGPYIGWLGAVGLLEDLLTRDSGKALLHGAVVPVSLVLDRAVEAAARELRALLDAFDEMSRTRAGLPAEDLMLLWAPWVASALEGLGDLLTDLDADPAIVGAFRAGLDRAWTLAASEE